jgi:hypothetical protein
MKDQYNEVILTTTDQLIFKMPRRLPAGYGRISQNCHFQGDNTNFNDATSVLKWIKHKVSLGATKTVMG